jgi:di/tricarboxylate transporter
MIILQLKSDSFNSGFSTWLVQYLITLRGLPVWVINLIVSIIAATMTEVVSNTATANVLLPILLEMSLTLCQNPTYLGKLTISSQRNHFLPFFKISR